VKYQGCEGPLPGFPQYIGSDGSDSVFPNQRKENMMFEEPIHVTDSAFEQAVMKSELPVVVDFWAPWCGPCKMVAPLLDQAAKKYAGKLIVAKVDVDENDESASAFGVQSIPTLLFIRNGDVVNRHVGALPAAELDNLIQELLA